MAFSEVAGDLPLNARKSEFAFLVQLRHSGAEVSIETEHPEMAGGLTAALSIAAPSIASPSVAAFRIAALTPHLSRVSPAPATGAALDFVLGLYAIGTKGTPATRQKYLIFGASIGSQHKVLHVTAARGKPTRGDR
jgi:hypothetical protein